jgi:protein SCO1/2
MKRILVLGIVAVAAIFGAYQYVKPAPKKLPVLNPVDLESEMVDSALLRIGYGHKIGDFSFLNQAGKKITRKEVEGKVFVVEYFFTTCKSICPIMNSEMKRIQKAYREESDLKILSFTVDPAVDTVEQMRNYASSHDAIPGKWHFLTGDKKKLYQLARTSFFVLKPAEAQNLGDAGSDFIHTNNFVLVDRALRIRGYYDGTDHHEVDQLIDDIAKLVKE